MALPLWLKPWMWIPRLALAVWSSRTSSKQDKKTIKALGKGLDEVEKEK